MYNLGGIYSNFVRKLDIAEDVFVEWVANSGSKLSRSDLMFLEGLLSTVWQNWGMFSRGVVMASALGCTTRGGVVVSGVVLPLTRKRVSYVAMRASKGAVVHPGFENSVLRKEPTWGDVSMIQKVIQTIGPGNMGHLISAFGSVTRGPRHLQVVRNAAAHRNAETFAEVQSLRAFYTVKKIRHPSEVALWIDPGMRDYALLGWIAEMRLLADVLTN